MTDNIPSRRMPAVVSSLLAALGFALGGCVAADDDAARTPTAEPTATLAPVTPTVAPPEATPTPDLQALLRDGGIAIIQIAYDRLLDEYIEPLEPEPLLSAGWDVMAAEADALGVGLPARPSFAGDRAAAFAAFAQAYVRVANATADPTKLRYAFIRGMTDSLNDCHTFFLNPVASDTLVDSRAGRGSVGVGVELAGVPPLVTEVVTGGPAARAGVLVGDRIASIDGADASGFGPASAFDRINGEEGTSVTLRLSRPGADAPVEVTMQRERVVPPNLELRVLEGGIGYVRLRHFVDGGVKDALQGALTAFETEGVTRWIIDLRGNPGGRLDPGAISLFVRDGVIVRDRGRDGQLEEERATGDLLPVIRPTVLLTNNRTGSVAEVFAAALKEYGVARIVGTTTNGCVGYTDVRDFGDGSSMAVTTHVHLGPVSSQPLNGVGVTPDVEVGRTESDIANARDPQLDAAVGMLREE